MHSHTSTHGIILSNLNARGEDKKNLGREIEKRSRGKRANRTEGKNRGLKLCGSIAIMFTLRLLATVWVEMFDARGILCPAMRHTGKKRGGWVAVDFRLFGGVVIAFFFLISPPLLLFCSLYPLLVVRHLAARGSGATKRRYSFPLFSFFFASWGGAYTPITTGGGWVGRGFFFFNMHRYIQIYLIAFHFQLGYA